MGRCCDGLDERVHGATGTQTDRPGGFAAGGAFSDLAQLAIFVDGAAQRL